MIDFLSEPLHIEDNEVTIHSIEAEKRPRGRPKTDKPQREPTEPKKKGRPSKTTPPKEKTTKGTSTHL